MTDEEIAKEIAKSAIFKSDYSYDEYSVKHGAREMAEYKNQQFNKVCFGFRAILQHLGLSSEKITELLEVIAKDFLN